MHLHQPTSVAVRLLQIFVPVISASCHLDAGLSWKPVADSRLQTLHQSPINLELPEVVLSETWDILGPFRLGTREAIWGADPLEYEGGFHSLPYDANATFNSALAKNGFVQWSSTYAAISKPSRRQVQAALNVSFPAINWAFMQSVYGWSALQYQAWARGSLEVKGPQPQTIALFTDGILEFLIDGEPYFGGDMYQYHRVPTLIKLTPGHHTLELRLTRDVRALGGLNTAIEVTVHAELRRAEEISLDENTFLVSEIFNGRLGSRWASINVQNNNEETVEIGSVHALKTAHRVSIQKPLRINGHQSRPMIFEISLVDDSELDLPVEVQYRTAGVPGWQFTSFEIRLTKRLPSDPLRVTYLHPAQIVSYSILRPPPVQSCNNSLPAPVIAVLHGAGLEADSAQAREMLDAAYGICAWTLFPSGVTSWSGDDWHDWGVADVKAAVSAIADWAKDVAWDGPAAAVNEIIVAGHSNGGQGAWYFSTHFPDNVSAVAPVSGYTSIENYVPYTMWHNAEPLLSSVISRSRSTYKHELLVGNLAGIPVAQQHGAEDDNVPVYHARLMHELLGPAQWPSKYEELPGRGHWFEGVMTTEYLKSFYQTMANPSTARCEFPQTFTITVPASGTLGPKAGIKADQLHTPDMNGKFHVTRSPDNKIWHIVTRNIRRFHLDPNACARIDLPEAVTLDSMNETLKIDVAWGPQAWFVNDATGQWSISRDTSWRTIQQRHGRQHGALDAILRAHGTFTIRGCSPGVKTVALQISRNLLQYFAADSQIMDHCLNGPPHGHGNVITLAVGQDLPPALIDTYPIRIDQGHLVLSTNRAPLSSIPMQNQYMYGEHGLGAVFLRPLPNERLDLVVWGIDLNGLRQAARLVPTMTGSGQPEYVVLGNRSSWEGAAGVYAAGHFDWSWQISPGSYQTGAI